jgi:secreted trypsin-like serine protease
MLIQPIMRPTALAHLALFSLLMHQLKVDAAAPPTLIMNGNAVTSLDESSFVGKLEVDDGSFCSGSLIAPDLFVTAAHCVELQCENITDRGLCDPANNSRYILSIGGYDFSDPSQFHTSALKEVCGLYASM